MEEQIKQQLQTYNRLCKENDDVYGNLAAHFGMSDTAFWVLYAISHAEGPITQNDLCHEWFYPAQTVNSAVSKMVKDGLLALEVVPGTRNKKNIRLTAAGRELAARTISVVDAIESSAFRMFTPEERELYLSIVRRHVENLKYQKDRILGSAGSASPSAAKE